MLFTASDLELMLRGRENLHLVLTGVSTSGVVLSPLREATDKEFVLTALPDGCADADEDVHAVLTSKIFVRQAAVVRTGAWKAG